MPILGGERTEVPQQLVFANDLQRGGEYAASRKCYRQFFEEHPVHILRFKALFEIGDNYYYEKISRKPGRHTRSFRDIAAGRKV